MSVNDDEQELPLDPALERVRRKMARLLVVSISIMMVGLMAVLGAVVYKVSGSGSGAGSALETGGSLKLPDGAEVVSVSLDGMNVLLHLREGAGQSLLIFNLEDGNTIARVALE